MKKTVCAVALMGMSLPFLAQCAKNMRVVGPADAKKKIAIATLSSGYKDRITQGLADRYKGTTRVTMVPINRLHSLEIKKYDALVIIDALLAWQLFNARTRWFIGGLRDPDERKKIVVFYSAGKPRDDYSVYGVDCITGASEVNDDAEVVRKISDRIDRILK
ncbi:MAG TPA: hypothetical protein PLM53_03285 [Spirochaetota bacterium]|nr:hypothetical protein [Spirochaetota bacterium]